MTTKSAFPPIRKSDMYDSCHSLDKYRELRNLSHEASFRAAQSNESYVHMKGVLSEGGWGGRVDAAGAAASPKGDDGGVSGMVRRGREASVRALHSEGPARGRCTARGRRAR